VITVRRCFLVCYDISNAKRLRLVHRIVKGYGEAWQYSIFFCVLKSIDRVRIQTELEEVMNLQEDQVLLIDLGENLDDARSAATVIGQSLGTVEKGMVVI
jgi:CRISPR-associated protein Cas2